MSKLSRAISQREIRSKILRPFARLALFCMLMSSAGQLTQFIASNLAVDFTAMRFGGIIAVLAYGSFVFAYSWHSNSHEIFHRQARSFLRLMCLYAAALGAALVACFGTTVISVSFNDLFPGLIVCMSGMVMSSVIWTVFYPKRPACLYLPGNEECE